MCYKCEVCSTLVLPGQPQKKHQIFRSKPQRKVLVYIEYDAFGEPRKEYKETMITVRQLERELKVCSSCAIALALGKTVEQIASKRYIQTLAEVNSSLSKSKRKRLAPPFPVG